jgi:hypothetical protein
MSQTKILVLFPDEEHQKNYEKLKGIKAAMGDTVIKQSNFDQFQEGKRIDKFDFIIGFAPAAAEDDLEMQTEYWSYYSIAPVFSIIHKSASEDFLKKAYGESTICISCESDEVCVDDFKKAVDQCKAAYEKACNDDVEPSFKQFDKDNSGAIDKKEL